MMKRPILGLVFSLATLAAISGCGGSGTSLTAQVTRESAREAVRDALSSGAQARNSRGDGGRSVPMPLVPATRDGGGQDGGGQDGSDGDPGITRFNVGDPYPVGSGLYGRVVAFDTLVKDGTETVSRLDYDIFTDPEYTRPAGFSRFSLIADDTVYQTLAETVFTDAAPAPSRFRSLYRLDFAAQSTLFEFTNSGRNSDEGFDFETSTRWTSDGRNGTGSFAFEEKRDGKVATQSSGRFLPGGVFEISWLNARGYNVTITFAGDGSGTFAVTNPADPLCPATGSFNEEGIGTVRYADGTTDPFDLSTQQFWQ